MHALFDWSDLSINMSNQVTLGAGSAWGGVTSAGAAVVEGALTPIHLAKRALEARRTTRVAQRERLQQGMSERVELTSPEALAAAQQTADGAVATRM